MTTATETYPRRPLMLGRATDEERAESDRRAAENVAAYQANPTAEAWAAMTPDPAIWHPFCDAGKAPAPVVALEAPKDGAEITVRPAGRETIVYVTYATRERPGCGEIFASARAANSVLNHEIEYYRDGTFAIVTRRGFVLHRGVLADAISGRAQA